MNDFISRQAAIDKTEMLYRDARDDANYMLIGYNHALSDMRAILKSLPSAEPERTECIPDTKTVQSQRDCVDLAERVTATFYNEEYEEWTQQTVTIADILDSVCDEYTILPFPEPYKGGDAK